MSAQPEVVPSKEHRKMNAQLRRKMRENFLGYSFILPTFLVVGLFGLFPIGYAIYMSLFTWRVKKGGFIGIENYKNIFGDGVGLLLFLGGIAVLALAYWVWNNAFRSIEKGILIAKLVAASLLIVMGMMMSTGWGSMMVTGDKTFLNSLEVTLFYAILTVPTQLLIAIVLAYMLFQKIRGKDLFRMIYFLPYITPVVSTAVVFRIIFSPRDTSLANLFISYFKLDAQKWLFEPNSLLNIFFGSKIQGFLAGPSMALVAIALFGVWTFVGYNTVIFLAGLGSISKEVYEAAEMDGANSWNLFWQVTIPLLSPVTFYLSLVSFIGTFKAFNHIYVMQVPAAQNTVATASVEIFNIFYKANNYGYAAAQSILLFLIIIGLTFAQNKLFADKVFYG